MLMCWCIGKAASRVKEFYMLPVGDKLFSYDNIAVNTIVTNREGEVSSCDIPFSDNLPQFNIEYLRLTRQVAESCLNHDLTDSMVIGTSALVQYDIDGAVGMHSGIFNNPFIIWGKYRRSLFKTTPHPVVPVSSHTDGRCPCRPIPRPASTGDTAILTHFNRQNSPPKPAFEYTLPKSSFILCDNS